MICDEMQVAAHEDCDGRLDAAARAGYEAHLAGCAGCRDYRSGLTRVSSAFVASPLEGAPPDVLDCLGLGAPPAVAAPGLGAWRRPRRASLAGGLVAAALVAAVGLSLRPAGDPLVVAMSPTPRAEQAADAEAILTWFDEDADYMEPLSF